MSKNKKPNAPRIEEPEEMSWMTLETYDELSDGKGEDDYEQLALSGLYEVESE